MTAPTTYEQRATADVEAANRQAGPDPIRIGILTPVTGPGDATAGELVVRGARLGAEYLHEHGGVLGGRGVALVLQNDQATAATDGMHVSAIAGMTKLVQEEVIAALGQWHLRTTPGAAETAEHFGVPMFVENGHNTVTAAGRGTIFRTYFTIAERTALMFDFLTEQGMRRIGLIASDTVFAASTADTIEKEANRRRGFTVLRFDFEQETTVDVRSELCQIAQFKPDIVINAGVIRTNYLVINQAAEVGLRPDVPMMVTFAFPMRSADFWAAAGEYGNGIVWPATYYSPSWEGLTPIGRWFTDRYIKRYGSFPPDTSLSAFTDVTIVGQALDLVESDTRDDLIRGLESGEFETWRGAVRFDRDAIHWHHTPPELLLLQYQAVGDSFDDAAIVYPAKVQTDAYLAPTALRAGEAGTAR